MRGGYFPGVQALRGAAALLVVLQHSIVYACQAAGIGYEPYLKIGYGHWGVMLFFCISGFVIGLNRHLPAGTFAFRRALRIYPAHLAGCLIAIAVLAAAGIEAHLDVASATLLPVTEFNNSLHIPYWTLIFEVAFYALAAVVFMFRPSDRALSIAAAGWIVTVQFFGPYFPNETIAMAPGLGILLSPYTQLFALGFLGCLHFKLLRRTDPRWLLGAAAAALMVLSSVRMTPAAYVLVYGVACLAAVMLCARVAECPAPAVRFGDASYGLYLLHLPVLVALAAMLAGSWLAAFPFWLWAGMTAAATIAGTLFGFAEFWVHARLARRGRTRAVATMS
jgi:exopolysaccharide production protein ExoZ